MKKKPGTRRSSMASRQAPNRRRKGALAVALPWLRRFGIAVVLGVGLVWAASWVFVLGGVKTLGDAVIAAGTEAGFTVENVLVEGRVFTDAKALKAATEIKKGTPLLAVRPRDMKDEVEALPWVAEARVERRFPDTVYIHVTERTPLALWQKDKALYLVDTQGVVIDEKRLAPFRNLPLVIGPDAPKNAPALLRDIAAEPALAALLQSARRVDGRRWDLILKTGVQVKLPETDPALALRRLAEAQTQDSLLERDITAVDMREPGRITVRTRPGAVEDYKAHQAALRTEKTI